MPNPNLNKTRHSSLFVCIWQARVGDLRSVPHITLLYSPPVNPYAEALKHGHPTK